MIGAPITFYAKLNSSNDSYVYEFYDARNYSIRQEVHGYENAKAVFLYDNANHGEHLMRVRVWFTIFGNKAWVVDQGIF